MKKAYLRRFNIQDKMPEDVIIEYDGGTYNGARIVMLDARKHEPQKKAVALTDELEITYYDSNRLYVYKYRHLFSLELALKLEFISEEDITDIVNKYNVAVSSFLDVCDKHDFDVGTADLSIYSADNPHILPNAVIIQFDKNIILGGKVEEKELTVNYINSVISKKLVEKIGFHILEDKDTITCKVFITNNDIKKLPEIMNILASVPGILNVGCYNRILYPGT